MGRVPHYKYWSPEQEPDPTENFVGVLTQNLRKPVYYHNLYYKPDTVFIEDKSPSTTTNNQENPNLKITYNHQNSLENRGILEKIFEPKKYVSTTTGKNITKNIIGADSNYKKNTMNIHCRKTSNQDNLVPTQLEQFLCYKHYFNLRKGTINSFLYCFCNSMHNGYPQNKNNFSNKLRNKTGLRRPKYEKCKSSNMHREETDNIKVMYRDNFPSEIGHNCGTYITHQNRNNSSKIFKLFEITNVPTTKEDMVEYTCGTVDVDEVFKKNFKISKETSVTIIQNLNKSSNKLLDTNIPNIKNITNTEILNNNDSSFIDVDNSLFCITKQVRKNIEAAKVEFDTFLRRDKSTKNIKESYKTDKLSENYTEIKLSMSQENFVPSSNSTGTQNCDVTQLPDEKTSIVRPPEINERSIKTNIQPPKNEGSFI